MKTTSPMLAAALLSFPAFAADPWGNADAKAGQAKHDAQCVACHTKMYGGDGSTIYTRQGRMLSTKLDILQRTAACNAQMNTGWFPEEEAEVAAYLNQTYYHFKE
ncbi:MAG: cytochrome c [Dechloromonas sp.]|jgi:mono/diheme cytochrome c family protein|uniref:hypothetical protein n=1 Tax=Azonexus hydrophilus TaxID=418702 RepID=UPI0003FD7456|nr:hypothetical protein [Azonexus hydrophilus]MBS4020571.1 cytochrome c [Dechloromonas sp.]MCA1937365.1 cytochrome c [Dechloromonas sp.]